MSEHDRPSQPDDPSAAEEPRTPLRLASDDDDGSTLPMPEGLQSDLSAASSGSSAAGATSGRSSSAVGSGSSTGGFETMLGKIVVQAGLATREEVETAATVVSAAEGEHGPRTLADALVAREYATRHQLDRLRQEFEAKKSTQQIPGYKILKKLGSGAMATVFLARQISLDRLVAIKILPKKFSNNEKFIERFYKEGRAAAQLNHPNIVGAYDVGRAGEHHFFVMEYVDGPTVYDRIRTERRVPEREAIEIVKQVAKALEHAHERGFIHRDIKPKNLMITKSGRVKLADLGLARAMSDEEAARAEAGRAYGTPYYISPEQIRGELEIGPQADLYGLGATFYHMVTGRVPFEGKNPSAVMHKHLKEPLEPPDHVNPDLGTSCAQAIEMLLAKSRKDRYQTAADLIEDLDLIAQGKPPHFAHRTLDQAGISSLTQIATAPAVEPKQMDAPVGRRFDDPLFIALAAIAALSTLAAIVLGVVALSG